MSDPVRIGIIGCGRILPAHLRGYRLLREAGFDDFRITALVARNPDDAHMFRMRGQGPTPREPVARNPEDSLAAPHCYVSDFQIEEEAQVYDTVEDMLAAGVVDAVSITASLSIHHTVGVQCLEAGRHAMIEKPLAVTMRAGQMLVDAAERSALSLSVMEMIRYRPQVRMLRWLIERGDLGDIQMVGAASFGTPEWSPDKIVAETPWRHRKLEAGGGASLDIGVHLAHRLRYLVGEVQTMTAIARIFEPVRTRRDTQGNILDRVEADADDAFFALPEFENGAAGTLSFSWAGHGEPTALPGGVTLYGSRGCLKGSLLIRDDGTREEVEDIFEREASRQEKESFFPRGVTDAFALAYLDWMNAIRTGTQSETDGREGLRDMATAFSIMEAATAQRPVAVADVLSGRVDAYQREINAHYGL
jgi:predicted dehydrogenase